MNNLKIVNDIRNANAITHNGKFHIDEVFSTVLLTKVLNSVNLIRVENLDQLKCKNKIVYDIGKGKFDHHQNNALTREDGIKYCSFGLLWKEYGKIFLKKIKCKDIEYAWNSFDEKLVKTIDKIDNGQIENKYINNYLISDIIESYNPVWNSDIDIDIKFIEAVEFANKIFQNEINIILSKIDAKEYLKQQKINFKNNYIILEKDIPYTDFLLENDKKKNVEFIIYPSKRNGYEIRTLYNKKRFPIEWHKFTQDEFYKKYRINGMIYCHTNGELCIAENIDTAIKLINLT